MTLNLTVATRPTTHALSQLLAVLHSRGSRVTELVWTADPTCHKAIATLVVEIAPTRHHHVRAAIERLVDVIVIDDTTTQAGAFALLE
jgi:acetolactate synthase regulatory subunit